MSSNKSKNGFMQFCHHQKRLDPSLSDLSLPQLVERCSGLWESLSLAEKGSFKRSVSSLSIIFLKSHNISYSEVILGEQSTEDWEAAASLR